MSAADTSGDCPRTRPLRAWWKWTARRAAAARARWELRALPVVSELGDGALLAHRHEDRVVAEALVAAALGRDRPLEDPGASPLAAVRCQGDELADVARTAIYGAVQLHEELRDAVLCPACRRDSRPAAECGRLDPRVLAEDPRVRLPDLAPEPGFVPCVLVVRLPVLVRKPVRAEQLDLPARQRRPQLLQLVRVARRELRPQPRAPLHALDAVELREQLGDARRLRPARCAQDDIHRAIVAELDGVHLAAELLDPGQHLRALATGRERDRELRLLRPHARDQACADELERPERDEHEHGRADPDDVVAGAGRHPDRRHDPERRRRRQARGR